jgi:hypothetical protein
MDFEQRDVIIMKPTRKTVFLLLMLAAIGFAGLGFLQVDLFAKTANQELERLFSDLGVLPIPPDTDPLEIKLEDPTGKLCLLIFGPPGVLPV